MGKKSRKKKVTATTADVRQPPQGTTPAPTPTTNLRESQIVEESKGLQIPKHRRRSDGDAVDSILLSSDDQHLLETFVRILFEKNAVPMGLLFDKATLTRRMKEIWFDSLVPADTFRVPVIVAMIKNHINSTKILPYGDSVVDPCPILLMLSQWKLLHRRYGYLGGDEMVEIALRLGADPNCRLPNKTNSLFFAVKYGSEKTVQLLLNAGCDIHAKDYLGRTCLNNALERCDPTIIKILLDHHLPSTEMFSYDIEGGGGSRLLTTLDRVLIIHESFATVDHLTSLLVDTGLPISWKILGKPDVEDLCNTIILLRRKGATFSPNILSRAGGYFNGESIYDRSNASAFGADLKTLIYSLVGLWLPSTIKDRLSLLSSQVVAASTTDNNLHIISENEKARNAEFYVCPICVETIENTRNKKRKKALTLYCGHTFCWKCIYDYGHTYTNDGNNNKWCPLCQKLLCLEVCSRPPQSELVDFLMYGKEKKQQEQKWGPKALTDNQVQIECDARKIVSTTTSARNSNDDDDDDDDQRSKLELFDENKEEMNLDGSSLRTTLDLGISLTMMTNSLITAAPKLGRVVIPVTLKGVPILAYVSSTSPFTIASTAFVEMFGLRQKDLISKRFRAFGGVKLKRNEISAVDEFEIAVGNNICIKINTAICTSSLPDFVGLQLGWDFFSSLSYCTFDVDIDVTVQGGTGTIFMRSDVLRNSVQIFDQPLEKEEMRLYGRNGETFAMPLLHINANKQDEIFDTTVSFSNDQKFVECFWCCRICPDDMLACTRCSDEDPAYYCDKECQTKAYLVHKRFCHK